MFDVTRIAKLARIGLSEEEAKKLEQDLAAILGFIDKLKEVNVEGVESMAQATGLENIMRQDEAIKRDADSRKRILANAPEKLNGYIKVKAVFE